MNESTPRRRFKDLLGNANHLLITLLVGLSAVETGLITEAPAELRTTWNPKDPRASAARSRIMLMGMVLTRSTDALDVYLSLANREPRLFNRADVPTMLDRTNRSIRRKLTVVLNAYSEIDPRVAALVEIMITWRNRSVHSEDDAQPPDTAWRLLEQNKAWLTGEFQGIQFERLLSDFRDRAAPTFKEMASFIRATHWLVEKLDQTLLSEINAKEFLPAFIRRAASDGLAGAEAASARKRIIQSIWGRDAKDRPTKVVSFLINHGLSKLRAGEWSAEFPEAIVNWIASLKPKDVESAISAG